mmetsp:Transcript_12394/g.31228  ORF Transcript_12394/g.31228 Transcript_12394/m.31228 type:complete len:178 (-) Transcript_12394:22-555(-)
MIMGLEQSGDTILPSVVACRRLRKLLAWLGEDMDPRDAGKQPGTAAGDGILVPKELVAGGLAAGAVGAACSNGRPHAATVGERQLRLLAHPGETAVSMQQAVTAHIDATSGGQGHSVLIAVGPEGGWTDAEVELLSGRGFVHVSLGCRPLTTSVAAVALISIVGNILQNHRGAGGHM